VPFHVETINAKNYIVTTMRLAVEYITKKDYTDNWASEMHEEFAFWSFADWKQVLRRAGFTINNASHRYTSEWIVKQRWQGKVALYRRAGDELIPLAFPPTTVVMIGEKIEPWSDLTDPYQAQVIA
jgi:hypothetical protein